MTGLTNYVSSLGSVVENIIQEQLDHLISISVLMISAIFGNFYIGSLIGGYILWNLFRLFLRLSTVERGREKYIISNDLGSKSESIIYKLIKYYLIVQFAVVFVAGWFFRDPTIHVAIGMFLYPFVTTIVDSIKSRGYFDNQLIGDMPSVDGYVLPISLKRKGESVDVDGSQEYIEVPDETSILLSGATRSGKSETAKIIAYQMVDGWQTREPLIAYDRKDDWKRFFDSEGMRYDVLSADSAVATVTWDLFQEIEDERDFDRIARGLFSEEDTGQSHGNKFFDTASRQVFTSLCKYLWRTFRERGETPENNDLIQYVETTTRQEAYKDLSGYDDLRLAAQSLDPEAEGQAAGVWANLTQEINELFVGTFRSSPEHMEKISLREYYSDPSGTALVLSHPHGYGDAVDRIYKYLIDDAIRRALNQQQGGVMILDELPQLPALDNLDELVNVGAGENVRTLVTLQSVGQMQSTYGDENATSLLAGMPTQILLRSGDPETTKYYRGIIGQKYEDVVTVTRSLDGGSKSYREEERYPFDESFLTTMEPGECVVNRPDGWVHGHLYMLDNGTREKINQAL